jgi:hypothetical protein
MNLPFSKEDFLNVFQNYNLAVWPMQVVIFLTGIAAVYFANKNKAYSGKVVSSVLAFFWLWMGAVYHLMYFTAINKAAYVFGALFIIQGILFAYFGIIKSRISFEGYNKYSIIGAILIIYAMIIYPLLGAAFGHAYPKSPTFGLPCPTTIFTFGILLMANSKFPFSILIIPALWSIIGFVAALKLGVYEDTGLIIAGVMSVVLFAIRRCGEHKKLVNGTA